MTRDDHSKVPDQPLNVLYRINVLVESASLRDVEALSEQFEAAICDMDHDDPRVRCPRRWFIVIEDLDPEAASEWDDLLNE